MGRGLRAAVDVLPNADNGVPPTNSPQALCSTGAGEEVTARPPPPQPPPLLPPPQSPPALLQGVPRADEVIVVGLSTVGRW